jgi:undecaprenol kinase
MNMDSNGNRNSNSLLRSFSYAIYGIWTAILSERNMKIHVSISILVIGSGLFFRISKQDWLFVFLAIGGMMALELANTAIERVVDLVTEEYHPLAKQAKDLAAGAVFIFAIISVIIGIFIFLPYVQKII